MPATRADLIIALAAPAAVVALDVATGVYGFVWRDAYLSGSIDPTLFAALTAAKVAALAWVVGRGVATLWLRVAVFVWCVALIDFGVFARFINGGEAMLVALTVAEVGVLICWSMLSNTRWVWRLPIGLVAIATILPVATGGLGPYAPWMPLLTVGVACQIIVYFVLRSRGFRIAGGSSDDVDREPVVAATSQFGVKHLLVWSAATPPVLVVVRLIDWRLGWWLDGYGVFVAELPDALTLGVAIAVGSLAVVGMVLGSGPILARVVVGSTIASSVGYALHLWSDTRYRNQGLGPWPGWRSIARLLIDMREAWIPWCLLAFGLLAALLLFLRASGCRLRRQR